MEGKDKDVEAEGGNETEDVEAEELEGKDKSGAAAGNETEGTEDEGPLPTVSSL